MKRYGILNSVSVSVFSGRNTEVSVSVSVLKSVWIRYEIGIGIGIKLASIWNLVQFVACSCEYNIAIELKNSSKSVSIDLEPIPNLKSVLKKKNILFFFKNIDFRFGIGSKSVRYRYTEPINRYTESRYIVSSLLYRTLSWTKNTMRMRASDETIYRLSVYWLIGSVYWCRTDLKPIPNLNSVLPNVNSVF